MKRSAFFARRLTRVGAEQHGQPRDGFFVIFAFAAHIADPGWEMWHGDQFVAQPGKVRDQAGMHDAGGAFVAWYRLGSFAWFTHGCSYGVSALACSMTL